MVASHAMMVSASVKDGFVMVIMTALMEKMRLTVLLVSEPSDKLILIG